MFIDDISFDDEIDIFKNFISNSPGYHDKVQFLGVLSFFSQEHNKLDLLKNSIDKKEELNEWTRVVRNLTIRGNNGVHYDNESKTINAIITFYKWADAVYKLNGSKSIITFLKSKPKISSGLLGYTFEEEVLKAELINDVNWKEIIYTAERHTYYSGQVKFILEWSKDKNGQYNKGDFENYYKKSLELFPENGNGIKDELIENNLWRNTLMCTHTWYWLDFYNFINYKNKHRYNSYKRYLRNKEGAEIIKKIEPFQNFVFS